MTDLRHLNWREVRRGEGVRNILLRAGYPTVESLSGLSDYQLSQINGVGTSSLGVIRKFIRQPQGFQPISPKSAVPADDVLRTLTLIYEELVDIHALLAQTRATNE